VDQQLEGVHFPLGLAPAIVGRRLVAVNLSDVAAIGGRPTFGFLTLATPPGYDVKELLATVEKNLAKHGARLAGGDLARGRFLSTSLTLLAERSSRSRWLRRGAAQTGDRLWVGGTVGESALGRLLLETGARFDRGRAHLAPGLEADAKTKLRAKRAIRRHLLPEPQLELGEWLARRRRAACIDISDGLLLELERLCRASQVGALIDASRLPTSDGFEEGVALVGADPAQLALTGGEDYVLLFALPPKIRPPANFAATAIGRVRGRRGVEVVGSELPGRLGWDHFGG
jgi:thiamine-monophosphate kinase